MGSARRRLLAAAALVMLLGGSLPAAAADAAAAPTHVEPAVPLQSSGPTGHLIVRYQVPPAPIGCGGNGASALGRLALDGSGFGPFLDPAVTGMTYDVPHWAPDGSRLFASHLYSADCTTFAWRVFSVDAAGGDFQDTPLTQTNWAAVSPDSSKVAFAPLGAASLKLANIDGTGVITLVNAQPKGVASWSPDGTRLVAPFGDGTLKILKADGSGVLLSIPPPSGGFLTEPKWSPDGTRVAYTVTMIGNPNMDIWVMDASGANQAPLLAGTEPETVPEWSPDGASIAYLRGTAPNRKVWTASADGSNQAAVPGGDSITNPMALAWQPAPPPIIFVHGFLGSVITCGAQELWPSMPDPPLEDMRLEADGVTNLQSGDCNPSAAPNGQIVETVLGSDVYKSTKDFLTRIAPDSSYFYAWDWRKSPEQALAELDALVDDARTAHGTDKVVLMAHSMGGLVVRWYIDDATRAAKVARALTVATPYLGSPKTIFPLAAGIETPQASTMDALMSNAGLQALAKNLQGLYFLYPTTAYGGWLSVEGAAQSPLDAKGVADYVATLGGTAALLDKALADRAAHLDGFKTNGVDLRVVVGTGLNTIGSVSFITDEQGNPYVQLGYVNGDGTVPIRSAVQGPQGTSDPLGENVPIHYVCGVGHVALPGSAVVDDRIEAFLLSGGAIGGQEDACAPSGYEIGVYAIDPPAGAPAPAEADAASPATTLADPPQTLDEAELGGLVDVLDFGRQVLVITDTRNPATFSLPAGSYRIEVTRLTGGVKGIAAEYPLVEGEITLQAGSAVQVVDDGVPLPIPDTEPPTTTAPLATPIKGARLSGTSIPAAITWSGADTGGSGVAHYELQRSLDGGTTWSSTLASPVAPSVAQRLPSTGTVRYRIRAIDGAGLAGAWRMGPVLTPRLTQDSSTAVKFSTGWKKASSSSFSGGSVRYATKKGSAATLTFTGRSIAFVTTTARSRGKVRILVNGVSQGVFDLRTSTTANRAVVWQKTWATSAKRTVKVVVLGTSGRPRADVDAFVVVR